MWFLYEPAFNNVLRLLLRAHVILDAIVDNVNGERNEWKLVYIASSGAYLGFYSIHVIKCFLDVTIM